MFDLLPSGARVAAVYDLLHIMPFVVLAVALDVFRFEIVLLNV